MDPKCRLVAKGIKNVPLEELTKIFKTDKIEIIGKGSKVAFIQYDNPQQITEIYGSVRNLRLNGKNIKVEYCIPKNKYEERKSKKIKLTDTKEINNGNEKFYAKKQTEDSKIEEKKIKFKAHNSNFTDSKNKVNNSNFTNSKNKVNNSNLTDSKNKVNNSNLTDSKNNAKNSKKIIFYKNEEDFYNRNRKHFVFVSNLYFNITDEKIKDLFKAYGNIKNIERKFTEENRFNGRVTLEYASAPKDEIFTDDIVYENLLIDVEGRRSADVEEREENYRLFISNLNKTVIPKDITNLLKENDIKGTVNMKLDGLKKRNYGYCHIQFTGEEDLNKFVEKFALFKKLGNISYEKSK